ncbi:protein phosphatase 2C family protein [Candidatus Kaiserbacteria bacterium]|nr:protein phosphatase 2C family protein [Candidatus Kaiserbacteria bacterium]
MKWIIDSTLAKGTRKRVNQDRAYAHHLSDGTCFAAVLDGHGRDSECVNYCYERLPALVNPTRMSGKSPEAFLWDVCKTLAGESRHFESGTTFSAAYLFRSGWVSIAVIGDSPIIARLPDGKLFVSQEHNARTNKSERERAVAQGAFFDGGYIYPPEGNHGLQLTRALGDNFLDEILSREPSIASFSIARGAWVLLASDGLSDPAHEYSAEHINELAAAIEKDAGPAQLIDQACAWGSEDDITAILCRLN